MTVEIIPISTPDGIAIVERLAREIWTEHFTPIIGASQVEYMLEKFQSADAMMGQISHGGKYYLAMVDNKPVGYAGLVPDMNDKRMMLSKLYVKDAARGKGVGKAILDFIEYKCELEGLSTLWLTVNRFNNSPIAWYKRHGFKTVDEVKKDIGGGYFMDDYIMEKNIETNNNDHEYGK